MRHASKLAHLHAFSFMHEECMHASGMKICMQDLHACLNSVTQITDSSPGLGLGARRTTLARLIKLHDRLYLPVQTIYCVE